MLRLQKFLADCGVASRRGSEELISNGEITVNGKIIKELGTKVDPKNDIIVYKGNRIYQKEDLVYIILYKPEGFISTADDQFERKTVLDLLLDVEERVYPVGRLDYETSGFLFLTNDGDLTYKLTHPKFEVEKSYVAKIKGFLTENEIKQFEEGLEIEDYKTAPAKIKVVRKDRLNSVVEITIHEGKNRQVRKMCDAINHEVISLKRISLGPISLGSLKRGEYRYLTEDELKKLKNL